VWTRYCSACDSEFRADVDRCSDCGGPLEPRFEDPEVDAHTRVLEPSSPPREAPLPPGRYLLFRESSDFHALDSIAERLGRAGIPFVALGTRRGFTLRLRAEDRQRADAVSGGQGPPTADDAAPDPEKGDVDCPACGAALGESAEECPDCGLVLSASEPSPLCRYCGANIVLEADHCSHCGRRDPLA
jgi:hypothetical protein